MKKIGEYTCMGQVAHQDTEKITLFDGRFDTGWRITSFVVTPKIMTSATDCFGTLATVPFTSNNWNFRINTELGWAAFDGVTKGAGNPFSLVDPDNLIVEDLYVRCTSSTGGGTFVNYMITMEKYEFSDWRGALAMVRNAAQGEPA
jgi:hypothetical protein